MVVRKIVKIDEELCDGCGLCVSPCVEGAITIVNGKAKVLREELCDGAGVCIANCPKGALTIEEREARPFDEEEAMKHLQQRKNQQQENVQEKLVCFNCNTGEEARHLLPVRFKGEDKWVCVRCLPPLIHG